MKHFAYYSQKLNIGRITDAQKVWIYKNSNPKLMQNPTSELLVQIQNIINKGKPFDSYNEALEFIKAEEKESYRIKREFHQNKKPLPPEFEANLSDFWRDVDSRVGQDTCTPFIQKFPNHLFTFYAGNFIWCKSKRTVYLLRGFKGGVLLPKYNRIVNFGEDF